MGLKTFDDVEESVTRSAQVILEGEGTEEEKEAKLEELRRVVFEMYGMDKATFQRLVLEASM